MIHRSLGTASDLIQRNEIVKISKSSFFLISTNKDSLCSGIQTYFSWNNIYLSIILWCFSDILPLDAKSYGFKLWTLWKLLIELTLISQRTLFSNFWKNLWWSIHLLLFVTATCLYQKLWPEVRFCTSPSKIQFMLWKNFKMFFICLLFHYTPPKN